MQMFKMVFEVPTMLTLSVLNKLDIHHPDANNS